MQRAFRRLAAALFLFFLPWLTLCSEQPCTPECYKSLQLTRESLDHFTAHLANGPTDPLVVELQKHLATHLSYQKLCLKYVIGAVAIYGKVDGCSLRAIRECCDGKMTLDIPNLLDKLIQKNDLDAVAHFVADNLWQSTELTKLLRRLMKESWDVIEGLVMKALRILESDPEQRATHRFMLRRLPAERLYEMIRTGKVSLCGTVCSYNMRDNRLLKREMFFLARYSKEPCRKIREKIARCFPYFSQFLFYGTVEATASEDSEKSLVLNGDIWCHASKFIDIETLVGVMPLVCSSWCRLHRTMLAHDWRIHELYLKDLSEVTLDEIDTVVPWSYCMRNGASALKYFGHCIECGALDKIKPEYELKLSLNDYLKAVAKYRTFPLRMEDCDDQYSAFIKLFEKVYKFCGSQAAPTLGKPEYLAEKDYERAIYHFVYEKGWILKLSESLVVDDMPRLFSVIKEDEGLMCKLIDENFGSFIKASLALIECGRTKQIPDKLARLVFGHTSLFRGLVEPRVVPRSEYTNTIVSSGTVAKMITHYFIGMNMTPRILVCAILCSRSDPGKIDLIAGSIAREFMTPDSREQQEVKRELEQVPFRSLMATDGYCSEDFEFFKGVMARCGLWDEGKV